MSRHTKVNDSIPGAAASSPDGPTPLPGYEPPAHPVLARVLLAVSTVFVIAGVAVLCWPLVQDIVSQSEQTATIQAMTSTYNPSDSPEAKAARAQAIAYNRALARSQFGADVDVSDPIPSANDPAVTSETDVDAEAQADADAIAGPDVLPYDRQLVYDGAGDVICWIEIPKISVELPIYHHTDEASLAMGVGHLDETSLPVGGHSTHCVISAHSGMREERMFDDIRQLSEGDLVCLHTLGREYMYEVASTEVVWPEETSSLAIRPGQDLLTLVTCTPYGVNDHRLLVHCRRTTRTFDRADPEPAMGDVMNGGGVDYRTLVPVSAGSLAAVAVVAALAHSTRNADRWLGRRPLTRRQRRRYEATGRF